MAVDMVIEHELWLAKHYATGDYGLLRNMGEWDAVMVTRDCIKVLRHGRVARFGGIRAGYDPSRDEVRIRFDLRRNDAEYWHAVRAFLEWLGERVERGRFWAKCAYKNLRRARYEMQAKEWEDALPKEIAAWAQNEIARAIEEHDADCADNSRAARIGNTGQMRRYRRQKAHGCCGFADWEATGPDGKRYVLGYNYGH